MEVTFHNQSISKVLVRGVNWIGDTIITLPTIESIRNVFPRTHISVLIYPHLSSFFKRCAFVDEIIHYPIGKGLKLVLKEKELVKIIRQKRFDLAVILPRSFRSALIPYLARIPFRIGYSTCKRKLFLTHGLDEREELLACHQVEYYYHIAQSLGAKQPFGLPTICLDKEEQEWVQIFLKGAGVNENTLLIGINPGSTYGSAKCWFPERYLELARRLINRMNVTIILVSGKDNAPLISHIASNLNGHVIKAVGEDLLHLAALIKRCRLFITNDTGPMHIAAAVGTPVVALFGSTNPVTTSPLGKGNRIVRKEVSCSPCLRRECPDEHKCMELISVNEVEKVVMDQLNMRL